MKELVQFAMPIVFIHYVQYLNFQRDFYVKQFLNENNL